MITAVVYISDGCCENGLLTWKALRTVGGWLGNRGGLPGEGDMEAKKKKAWSLL